MASESRQSATGSPRLHTACRGHHSRDDSEGRHPATHDCMHCVKGARAMLTAGQGPHLPMTAGCMSRAPQAGLTAGQRHGQPTTVCCVSRALRAISTARRGTQVPTIACCASRVPRSEFTARECTARAIIDCKMPSNCLPSHAWSLPKHPVGSGRRVLSKAIECRKCTASPVSLTARHEAHSHRVQNAR